VIVTYAITRSVKRRVRKETQRRDAKTLSAMKGETRVSANRQDVLAGEIARRGMSRVHIRVRSNACSADYTRHMNVGEVVCNAPLSKHVRRLFLYKERVAGYLSQNSDYDTV
jgi:hypothetical protein